MSKRYNAVTPRAKKDGGTFWHRVGTGWENEKGIQIVLDSNPIPDAEGRCVINLFEAEDNRSGARDRRDAQARARHDDLDDEVPF